ncbi:hypothetical protein NQ317_001377 [Molorchus minor]|uniref:Uncharacterized protein n=1 Tax=Molorchus minor TaxID=1323400 RepID=A0ABQ9J741_9CUCU|nr:hypothetical protein NQ317_001377 [Molorchus minor]
MQNMRISDKTQGSPCNRHLLFHKNVSEVQVHKCEMCKFETKHKENLKKAFADSQGCFRSANNTFQEVVGSQIQPNPPSATGNKPLFCSLMGWMVFSLRLTLKFFRIQASPTFVCMIPNLSPAIDKKT